MRRDYNNLILRIFVVLFMGISTQARLMFMEMNETSAVQYSRRMDNQHIVLMGDSLMRYQYISLAYLIHNNKVVDPATVPNILLEKTYEGWVPFWKDTHSVLAPYEYCDCSSAGYEHRYYYNPQRNISISFIIYAGDYVPAYGGWLPSNGSNHVDHGATDDPIRWKLDTVEDRLTQIAAKLTPKPTTLVLNAGHWRNKWNETAHRGSVLDLAKSLFPRVIWKTTNYPSDHRFGGVGHDIHVSASDAAACAHPGIECMNLGWTKYLDSSNYWDRVHFKPEIYTDVNIQFMHQLLHHKPLVVAPFNKEHHAQIVHHAGKQYIVDRSGVLRPFTMPTGPCLTDFVARNLKNVHMAAGELIERILGNHVDDICGFYANHMG